jgi:hypothetical protein
MRIIGNEEMGSVGRNAEFMFKKYGSHSVHCACKRLSAFRTNFYSVPTIQQATIYYSVSFINL